MEVDEKPTEDYSDIGGLDKQIQELVEAIVLPVTHKEKFKALGIKPPKVRCSAAWLESLDFKTWGAATKGGCAGCRGCCSMGRLAQARHCWRGHAQHRPMQHF